jgi:NAD(P)-dependent dehydrogenase (short-subunit alcohol dehydrogenase family)
MKVIITGSAGGIGRMVALKLAQDAARLGPAELLLVDRDGDNLEKTAGELRKLGAKVLVKVVDLGDPNCGTLLAREAETSFGGLDALVSNAGTLHSAPLKDLDIAEFDRIFDINTRPTWLIGKAVHPLLARSKGALVATGSISSEHPSPPLGGYSASKAALVMLVRQMAVEWGPDGIRCNCVSPGPTLTPMTQGAYADAERKAARESMIPLRRLGAPEDVANAIVFLISPAGSFISGVNLMVDGGLGGMLMPAIGGGGGHAGKATK